MIYQQGQGIQTKRVQLNMLKIPQQQELSDDQRSQQAMSLFTGTVIHGGQFSNSINSLDQSLKLALQEAKVESSPKRYKRLKVLDSDFD